MTIVNFEILKFTFWMGKSNDKEDKIAITKAERMKKLRETGSTVVRSLLELCFPFLLEVVQTPKHRQLF